MLQLVPHPLAPAMELLCRPDLLDLMAADLEAMGAVGETANKKLLYLAMVSRLLPRPVNVVVKGPSSSGKSFLVTQVAELFEPHEVLMLSQMSAKALYYMDEDALRHRVLFIDEYVAHAQRDHALRLMQSEGRLHLAFTARGSDGFEARTRTVNGPIAFITTTTRPHIFDENETRAFALHMDCSEAQTRRIHDAQRRARSLERPVPRYSSTLWQQASAMLAPQEVVIPFAEYIHLASTGQARDRRDLGRLLSLVEASALAHQYQRRVVERAGGRCLEAELEDYRVAWELAAAFLPQPEAETPVEALVERCGGFGPDGASHYQLMDALGWSRPTVIKYCGKALRAGRLQLLPGSLGGQKRYVTMGDRAGSGLTSPEEVASRWNRASEVG